MKEIVYFILPTHWYWNPFLFCAFTHGKFKHVANLFYKGPTRPLFCLFLSFQTNIITIFITNICEKCPSSIRCRDSNLQPLEHEPPPVTTRPGLPPLLNDALVVTMI